MNIYRDTFEKISEITKTDYKVIYLEDADGEYVMAFDDSVNSMLEDLLIKIDSLNQEIENLKKDIEDNYKPISIASQVNISDKDFV